MSRHPVRLLLLFLPLCSMSAGCGTRDGKSSPKVEATFVHQLYQINSLAFSPDGKYLAAGSLAISYKENESRIGRVLVWDRATQKQVASLDQGKRAGPITFSPDGKLMAVASGNYPCNLDGFHPKGIQKNDGEIRLYEVATWKLIGQFQDNDCISALLFSADNKTLASAGFSGPASGGATMWDIPTGKALFALQDLPAGEPAITFQPQTGDFLLARKGTPFSPKIPDSILGPKVLVLDPHNGKMKREIPIGPNIPPPDLMLVSADGTKIFGQNGYVMDYETGKVTNPLFFPTDMQVVQEKWALSPNGRFFALMERVKDSRKDEPRVGVWDQETLTLNARWGFGRNGFLTASAFSPDSKSLAVAISSGEIKVFRIPE